MEPKILIIGAGPTGLTAVAEFARMGIIPDIIDKNRSAQHYLGLWKLCQEMPLIVMLILVGAA